MKSDASPRSSRNYDRLMLRSAFQSLFWSVILDKKRKSGLTLTKVAESLGVDKAYVSRSFSSPPNWQVDKISDMAEALGVELELFARDTITGELFSPTGKVSFSETSSDRDAFVPLSRLAGCAATTEDGMRVVSA